MHEFNKIYIPASHRVRILHLLSFWSKCNPTFGTTLVPSVCIRRGLRDAKSFASIFEYSRLWYVEKSQHLKTLLGIQSQASWPIHSGRMWRRLLEKCCLLNRYKRAWWATSLQSSLGCVWTNCLKCGSLQSSNKKSINLFGKAENNLIPNKNFLLID